MRKSKPSDWQLTSWQKHTSNLI